MSSDLVTFVRARLDEDEQVARRIETTWRCIAGTGEIVASDGTNAEVCAEAHWEGVGEHIARHDPARVLREVEAKRRVLDLAVRVLDLATSAQKDGDGVEFSDPIARRRTRDFLREMAAVWSDHPDYRAEWAP